MAKTEKGFLATSYMDAACVGSWRPHRPRGPIMAQFTSPGPKYSVPGTTGYWDHIPTKTRAPAYTFRGVRPPMDNCSPGPRYYIPPSITKNGKSVVPAHHFCGRPEVKTSETTPGPSDYSIEKANKHLYKCEPVHSLSFWHKPVQRDQTPGPDTYTLPRLVGPNTACTHASPCYSINGKSKHNSYSEDHAKTPGPAARPIVELDVFKKRAPIYTMGKNCRLVGDMLKPGPSDYCPGKASSGLKATFLICWKGGGT